MSASIARHPYIVRPYSVSCERTAGKYGEVCFADLLQIACRAVVRRRRLAAALSRGLDKSLSAAAAALLGAAGLAAPLEVREGAARFEERDAFSLREELQARLDSGGNVSDRWLRLLHRRNDGEGNGPNQQNEGVTTPRLRQSVRPVLRALLRFPGGPGQ